LLNHAETAAALLGLSQVHLFTNEVMTENLTFYRRRGYTKVGRGVQDGYRRDFFRPGPGQAARAAAPRGGVMFTPFGETVYWLARTTTTHGAGKDTFSWISPQIDTLSSTAR
jgi:hypothetical protein